MSSVLVRDSTRQPAGRWLKCFRSHNTAKLRLICFPFAGGGANFYRRWPDYFAHDFEVHAVQLPGRETRIGESCVGSADEVADAVMQEITPLGQHVPLVFFGHSLGTLLAYEVAHRLRERHNWEPKIVFVSGRQAPLTPSTANFHTQSDEVFISEIKRLNGTPDAVFADAEMRGIVLPMLRSDYKILETYRLQRGSRLTCPIITCVGNADREATAVDMLSWNLLTNGPCIGRSFAGDHFYLKAQLGELAGFINECLLRFAIV